MWRYRRSRMGIRPAPVPLRVVIFIYFLCFVSICGGFLVYIEDSIKPMYEQLAESVSRRVATDAISAALLKDIAQDTQSDNLLKVILDKDGRVTAAQVNSLEVARLQSMLTRHVQDALNDIPPQDLSLQLGLVFHNTLMAGLGPTVGYRLLPVGNAMSSMDAVYQQAGLNQTLNILYLNITAQVRIVAPFLTKVVEINTRVPMVYILLAGQMPANFYNAVGAPFMPGGMPQANAVNPRNAGSAGSVNTNQIP